MTQLESTFSNIADAIRAKGATGTMTPLEMPTKISNLPQGATEKYGGNIKNFLADLRSTSQGLTLYTPNGFGDNTFSFVSNDIRIIDEYALQFMFVYTGLQQISLPNLTEIKMGGMQYACRYCTALTSVSMPSLMYLREGGLTQGFAGCTSLVNVDLSGLQQISGTNNYIFNGCTSLQTVSLSSLKRLDNQALSCAFYGCTNLKKVYLTNLETVTVSNAMQQMCQSCPALELVDFSNATSVPYYGWNMFLDTNNTYKIVVPDSLYNTWVATSGWVDVASHIVKKSEYYT